MSVLDRTSHMTSPYEYMSHLQYALKHRKAGEEESAAAIDSAVEEVKDATVAVVDAEANANAIEVDILKIKYMQLK